MNPVNIVTVLQGIASKKLMLVMWVLYLLSGVAEKMPTEAERVVYVMAALSAVFLGCQTALDFKLGVKSGDTEDPDSDPDDTMVPGLGVGSAAK
jgi:hypothetical protein